jgi:hypothetical protein
MAKEMTELEKRLRAMRSNQDKNSPEGMLRFKQQERVNTFKKPKGSRI